MTFHENLAMPTSLPFLYLSSLCTLCFSNVVFFHCLEQAKWFSPLNLHTSYSFPLKRLLPQVSEWTFFLSTPSSMWSSKEISSLVNVTSVTSHLQATCYFIKLFCFCSICHPLRLLSSFAYFLPSAPIGMRHMRKFWFIIHSHCCI